MIAIVKITQKCNLDCIYCFDRDATIPDDMTLETVEEICKKDINKEIVDWTWFGGESTIMGLTWFKEAHKIIRKYYPNMTFSIQTNGTLLNQDWINFFKEENFKVGISFDGLSQEKQRGSSGRTLSALKLLLENDIHPGVISVISDDNYDQLLENYLYMKSLGLNSLTINKVYDSARSSGVEKDQIENYLKSFEELFNYWLDDESALYVEQFNGFLKGALSTGHYMCNLTGDCRNNIIGFNQKGQIEPCDRYFPDYYKTPLTIHEYQNLDEAKNTKEYKHLTNQRELRKTNFCKDCEIFDYCNGGCPADALFFKDGLEYNPNVCYTRKREWGIIFNKIKNLSPEEIKNKDAATLMFFNRNLSFIDEIRREMNASKFK